MLFLARTAERQNGEHDGADQRLQQLSQILGELDELKEKQRTGKVTPEDVQGRREELDRIIAAMPSDVRADYERMRIALELNVAEQRDAEKYRVEGVVLGLIERSVRQPSIERGALLEERI